MLKGNRIIGLTVNVCVLTRITNYGQRVFDWPILLIRYSLRTRITNDDWLCLVSECENRPNSPGGSA